MSLSRGIFRWRGWISALIIAPAAAAALLSPPWCAEGGWLDVLGDFAAWLLLGAGTLLRLWATLYIGGRKSITLVTTGPYALCRHPLYVASFFILLSLAAFLLSLTLLAAACLAGLIYALAVVPSEERHALRCFGSKYRAYADSMPRFVPNRARMAPPGVVEVKVGAFLRECARTYGLIALGAAVDLLAHCRMQLWWPTPFHAP